MHGFIYDIHNATCPALWVRDKVPNFTLSSNNNAETILFPPKLNVRVHYTHHRDNISVLPNPFQKSWAPMSDFVIQYAFIYETDPLPQHIAGEDTAQPHTMCTRIRHRHMWVR